MPAPISQEDSIKFLLACLKHAQKPDFDKVSEELGGTFTATQLYKKYWALKDKYKEDPIFVSGLSPRKEKSGAALDGTYTSVSEGVKKRRGRPSKKKVVEETTEEEADTVMVKTEMERGL